MTSVQTKPSTEQATTFDSLDPATDEVVGTYPINTALEVTAAVQAAR